jgi:hypothetical protein
VVGRRGRQSLIARLPKGRALPRRGLLQFARTAQAAIEPPIRASCASVPSRRCMAWPAPASATPSARPA